MGLPWQVHGHQPLTTVTSIAEIKKDAPLAAPFLLTSHGVAHPALSKTIAPRQQAVHQKNENGLMGWITADLEDKQGRQGLRQVQAEVLPPEQMRRDTAPSVMNETQKDSLFGLFGIFPGLYHCSHQVQVAPGFPWFVAALLSP